MMPQLSKGRGLTGALRYVLGEGNDPITGQRKSLDPAKGTRAEVLGGQHFGFPIHTLDDVDVARRVMEWAALPDNQAGKTRICQKDLLHLSLSWHPDYEPGREEMIEACQSALKALGMEGTRAIFIAHTDTRHRHVHIIASRINPLTRKAFPDHMDQTKIHAWAIKWEREKGQIVAARQELHDIIQAIIDRDVDGVIDGLTRRESVFSRNSLERKMIYAGLTAPEREAFRAQVLARYRVIPLRESAEREVSHFTTREILAAERALQRDARALVQDLTHGMSAAWIEAMAVKFTLDAEQRAALEHACGLSGFAIIDGQAGTGKSRVLSAVREGYEHQDYTVIGMAWTNQVVAAMREKDDYRNASTISFELYYQNSWRCARGGTNAVTEKQREQAEKDYGNYSQWMEQHHPNKRELDFDSFVIDRQSKARRWDHRTVLVLDEAAMPSTETLAEVLKKACDARAKVILAGDAHQLGSIDKGGMFEPLKNEHGAAVLTDVKRVADPDQKHAFNAMHDRDFGAAMKVFNDQNAIHWSPNATRAAHELAQRYIADHAANPEKDRFVFAYTNELANDINQHIRAFRRQRGDLGHDHTAETAHGQQTFAAGDRIQFTKSGHGQALKKEGFINGAAGVIAAIEMKNGKAHFTVKLDHSARGQTKQVTFAVGADRDAGEFNAIKLGYAGTIYRGQGRTLDQTYLLHSKHWRESSGYVALTRHREKTAIFASHDVVKNLDELTQQLQKPERKSAAHAYHVDESTLRHALDQAPQREQVFAYDPHLGSRFVDAAHQQEPGNSRPAPATARGQSDRSTPARDPSRSRQTDDRAPRDQAVKLAAAKDRGRQRGRAAAVQASGIAHGAGRAGSAAARTTGNAVNAVARSFKIAANVFSGLASTFEKLFDNPSPELRAERKAEQQAFEEAKPSFREIREKTRQEQVRVDEAELAKARQEFLRRYGKENTQQHELRRDHDPDRDRDRDRSR